MQDAIKEFMSTRDLRPLMLPRDTRIRCTPLCARYTTSIYVCGATGDLVGNGQARREEVGKNMGGIRDNGGRERAWRDWEV